MPPSEFQLRVAALGGNDHGMAFWLLEGGETAFCRIVQIQVPCISAVCTGHTLTSSRWAHYLSSDWTYIRTCKPSLVTSSLTFPTSDSIDHRHYPPITALTSSGPALAVSHSEDLQAQHHLPSPRPSPTCLSETFGAQRL